MIGSIIQRRNHGGRTMLKKCLVFVAVFIGAALASKCYAALCYQSVWHAENVDGYCDENGSFTLGSASADCSNSCSGVSRFRNFGGWCNCDCLVPCDGGSGYGGIQE